MTGWLLFGALAIWGGIRLFGRYPRPGETYGVLSRREAALVEAAAEAMFPPGGAVPPSGVEAAIPAYTDRYLAVSPPNMRLLMRLLFLLVEQATLIFGASGRGGRRRFSSLSVAQRVEVLEGWSTSRFVARRLVFTSLRAILTMGYFGDAAVLRALRLAPYEIETPVTEADLLYPRIGESQPHRSRDQLTSPSDGTPLDLDGPLHPDYVEGAP